MGYMPSLYTTGKAFMSLLAIGVASTAMLLYRYQRSLIYPSNFPAGSRTDVLLPDQFGIDEYEELMLRTPDGESLHAFLLPQRHSSDKERARGAAESESEVMARRPTVLFLHANAGNMGHRLPLAAVFYKRYGCNVLMLSYRGYGRSTGEASEKGIRIDAQTALEYILGHKTLSKTFLVAYGQSIGGAVAIDLVSRNQKSIGAMILENTFLSIPQLIPHVLPPVRPFAFLCREIWPSSSSITKMAEQTPVLFLSGRKDELVPPLHMDTLFARCSSKQKVWMSLVDGTHNDTCVKPGYFESIGLFLAKFVIPATVGGQEAADAALSALSGSLVMKHDEQIDGYRIVASSSTATATKKDDLASSRLSTSSGEWVEMTAQDAAGADSAPSLSVAPQDAVKENATHASKGKL